MKIEISIKKQKYVALKITYGGVSFLLLFVKPYVSLTRFQIDFLHKMRNDVGSGKQHAIKSAQLHVVIERERHSEKQSCPAFCVFFFSSFILDKFYWHSSLFSASCI